MACGLTLLYTVLGRFAVSQDWPGVKVGLDATYGPDVLVEALGRYIGMEAQGWSLHGHCVSDLFYDIPPVKEFRKKFDFDFIFGDRRLAIEMVAAGIAKAGSTDPIKLAQALEDVGHPGVVAAAPAHPRSAAPRSRRRSRIPTC